jgi:hypothetical protein
VRAVRRRGELEAPVAADNDSLAEIGRTLIDLDHVAGIEPGHRAWVVGEEPCELVDW